MSNGFGFDLPIPDFPFPDDPGGLTEFPPFDPGGITEFPPDTLPPIDPNAFPGGPDIPPEPSPIPTPPPIPTSGQGPPPGGGGGTPGGISGGGSQTPPPQVDPLVKTLTSLLALLLAGGGLFGAGKQIFGKPDTTTTITPTLLPQAGQLLGGAQQQFGQTGSILQNLLGAIQNPQIPPGLSLLAEQAFQPRLGDLYTQAAQAGRLRGFHDAPATSPPGGAIFGPGLANLQGQLAQSKLNLYQNNIGNILGALQGSNALAGNQGRIATDLPFGRTITGPPPTILNTLTDLSKLLGGPGGVLAGTNPPQAPPRPTTQPT